MSPFCLAALSPFSSFAFPAHFPFPQEDGDLPGPVKIRFFSLIQINEAGGEMQGVVNQNLVERALSITAFNELLQNITELLSFWDFYRLSPSKDDNSSIKHLSTHI